MATTNRKAALEAQLSEIAGYPVEVTVRGLRDFTFSFDEVNHVATSAILKFFGDAAKFTVETDEECGTFIYASV